MSAYTSKSVKWFTQYDPRLGWSESRLIRDSDPQKRLKIFFWPPKKNYCCKWSETVWNVFKTHKISLPFFGVPSLGSSETRIKSWNFSKSNFFLTGEALEIFPVKFFFDREKVIGPRTFSSQKKKIKTPVISTILVRFQKFKNERAQRALPSNNMSSFVFSRQNKENI